METSSKLVSEHQTVWKNGIGQLITCVRQKFSITFQCKHIGILLKAN